MDTGATFHLTADPSYLIQAKSYNGSQQILLGDNNTLPIQQTRKDILPTPSSKLLLSKLFHVSNLSYNLLSVKHLTQDNICSILFDYIGYTIFDQHTKQPILKGLCINGLYSISSAPSPTPTSNNLVLLSTTIVPRLWHRRLGYPSTATLSFLFKHHSYICISFSKQSCNTGYLAKSKCLPFCASTTKCCTPLELIHTDIWGSSFTTAICGSWFYIVFIDDYSCYTWLYPIKT